MLRSLVGSEMCIRDRAFTDEILARHGISKKQFRVFDEPGPAKDYIADRGAPIVVKADGDAFGKGVKVAGTVEEAWEFVDRCMVCLLYTSDAADDLLCVDHGGRRIIKKKNKHILYQS